MDGGETSAIYITAHPTSTQHASIAVVGVHPLAAGHVFTISPRQASACGTVILTVSIGSSFACARVPTEFPALVPAMPTYNKDGRYIEREEMPLSTDKYNQI